MRGTDIFKEINDLAFRRGLALVDRNPISPTYGCMDRNYWCYRFLSNFPSASYQSALFPLVKSIIDKMERETGDRFAELSGLASGSILYTMGILSDKPASEWFESERSYCGTVYLLSSLLECHEILKDSKLSHVIQEDALERVISGRAVDLDKLMSPHASNQLISHAYASSLAGSVLGNEKYLDRARNILEDVFNDICALGYPPEYGNLDYGYASLSLSTLARISMQGAVVDTTMDMAEIIYNCVAPVIRHAPAGIYFPSSRGTRFILPFGIKYFSEIFSDIGCFKNLAALYREGALPTPLTVDDRYFCMFFWKDFLQSGLSTINVPIQHSRKNAPSVMHPYNVSSPASEGPPVTMTLSGDGGMIIHDKRNIYVADRGNLISTGSRYYMQVNLPRKQCVTSIEQKQTDVLEFHYDAQLKSLPIFYQGPLSRLAFELFQPFLRFFPDLATRFQRFMKSHIFGPKPFLSIDRTITVSKGKTQITIHDSYHGKMVKKIKEFVVTFSGEIILSPASGLNPYASLVSMDRNMIRIPLRKSLKQESITLEKRYHINQNGIDVKIETNQYKKEFSIAPTHRHTSYSK